VERGVRTEVLTNSLAATDEPVVHSGYARYRPPAARRRGGAARAARGPGAEQHATARGASSGVSLHAKALVVDRQYTFIGSLNMDQRSKLLNTEMGVIVDSVPLALAVRSFFDTAIEPGNSFRVALEPPRRTGAGSRPMSWHWSEGGIDKSHGSEPGRHFGTPDAGIHVRPAADRRPAVASRAVDRVCSPAHIRSAIPRLY
jgi:putative cardiolipin synthase